MLSSTTCAEPVAVKEPTLHVEAGSAPARRISPLCPSPIGTSMTTNARLAVAILRTMVMPIRYYMAPRKTDGTGINVFFPITFSVFALLIHTIQGSIKKQKLPH